MEADVQVAHWPGNQSDRNNGVNLLPLEMIEALSRNGQDQCFPRLKGLWNIQGSVKTQIQVQKMKGLRFWGMPRTLSNKRNHGY